MSGARQSVGGFAKAASSASRRSCLTSSTTSRSDDRLRIVRSAGPGSRCVRRSCMVSQAWRLAGSRAGSRHALTIHADRTDGFRATWTATADELLGALRPHQRPVPADRNRYAARARCHGRRPPGRRHAPHRTHGRCGGVDPQAVRPRDPHRPWVDELRRLGARGRGRDAAAPLPQHGGQLGMGRVVGADEDHALGRGGRRAAAGRSARAPPGLAAGTSGGGRPRSGSARPGPRRPAPSGGGRRGWSACRGLHRPRPGRRRAASACRRSRAAPGRRVPRACGPAPPADHTHVH
jgi:hypothetical protein